MGPYPFRPFAKCIHCGELVDFFADDIRGESTCGEFAADPDMQDAPHDFDYGDPMGLEQ